jgi:alkanesulfonate monooxygenase SsuD/methylene tetrahydromethanopterin reductase-like flavin-dependent oxidoreductase (luciferase family)
MRLSTLILPIYRWPQARAVWQQAQELGFHAAYTYDHLAWRTFREGPWFGAIPTLTAAATATDRLRLGMMVTSPNFRHPVTLAKDLMTLDDISDGRLTVGIGAGGSNFDATVLGRPAWSPGERTERFEEFVPLLDRLLRTDVTTHQGRYYSASEAPMRPGCVQQPRVPLVVAAAGRRGMAVAAQYGQGWVTAGVPGQADKIDPADCPAAVADQLARLGQACAEYGRDPDTLEKVLLSGMTQERPLASLDAFRAYAERYAALGITEIVLHWPVPETPLESDPAVFEQVVASAAVELG